MKLIKTEFKTIQAYEDNMEFYFEITRMVAKEHDSSQGGYPWKAEITIDIDVKTWNKAKKAGQLGGLYLDFSNTLYHINKNIYTYYPTVNDRNRAKKGIKTIKLTYFSKDFEAAKRIGLEVNQTKGNEYYLGWNAWTDIAPIGLDGYKPELRLVEGGAA